jgi:hypothetical protein
MKFLFIYTLLNLLGMKLKMVMSYSFRMGAIYGFMSHFGILFPERIKLKLQNFMALILKKI